MTDCRMQVELQALSNHLQMLRDCKHFHNSILVFAIELNHCKIRAKEIYRVASLFKPCRVLFEGAKNKDQKIPGVWTSPVNDDKSRMQLHLNMFLSTNKVVFHQPFISSDLDTREMLLFQAKNYRRTVCRTAGADEGRVEPKVTYSGKHGGGKDDLVMCLMMCAYWGSVVWAEGELCHPHPPRIINGIKPVISVSIHSKRQILC